MMRKLILVVTAAAMLIGLTACGASHDEGATKPAAVTTNTPAPTKTQESSVAHFGQTYTYDDGLKLTVAAPVPYTPSQSSAGAVAGQTNLKFHYTIFNGTKEPYDPTLVQGQLNSGGSAASSITDIEQNIFLAPQGSLLPGQQIGWDEAFSVANPDDLTMTVTLDFSHKDALFTK